jgi:hypothetical protein
MPVQIGLSKRHLNSLIKGRGFQLKSNELNGSGPHQVELHLDNALQRRMQSAMNRGKGIRIPKGVMHTLLQAVKSVYRKHVPKGLRDSLSNVVIDGKKLHKNFKDGDVQESLDNLKSLHNNITHVVEKTKEFKGGRVAKGSQEAKDRMAKIRAMRKVVGGSTYAQRLARRTRNTFRPVVKAAKTVVNAVAPIAKKVAPMAKNIGKKVLKDVVKKGLPMVVTGALSAVGQPQLAPVVNATLTPALNNVIDKQINGLGYQRQPRLRSTTSTIRGGPPIPNRRRTHTIGGSMLAPSSYGGSMLAP